MAATTSLGQLSRTFVAPTGLTNDETKFCMAAAKLSPIRDKALQKIRDQHEGGQPALSAKYFSKPADLSDRVWESRRKLLTHVNLVAPVCRCWCSSITGGQIRRVVVSNPHSGVVQPWVGSVEYLEIISQWVENAALYGTAAAVAQYDPEEQEIGVWLPDPVSTYLRYNKMDKDCLEAVIEVKPERIEISALWGEVVMCADGSSRFVRRNHSVLPCKIAYGISRKHRGEPYGLPLVGDAADWSIACTAVAYNIRLMQTQQTASTLLQIGDLETLLRQRETVPDAGQVSNNTLAMPEGFQVTYLTPDPKIEQSINILKTFVGLMAISGSVPQDVVDATLTAAVGSAEAARIRSLPLIQRVRQLIPLWEANEGGLVLAVTELIEYFAMRENPVNMKDLKARTQTEIQNVPNVLPLSPNEHTSDLVARVNSGLTTPLDAAREKNERKTEPELILIAEEIKEIRDSKSGQSGDNALKLAKAASV